MVSCHVISSFLCGTIPQYARQILITGPEGKQKFVDLEMKLQLIGKVTRIDHEVAHLAFH